MSVYFLKKLSSRVGEAVKLEKFSFLSFTSSLTRDIKQADHDNKQLPPQKYCKTDASSVSF